MRPLLVAALLALPALSLADDGPRLLPAESWKKIMLGLERHFGTDASVDEPTLRELSAFLERHAGRRAAPAGDEPRITETAWFRKEHRKAKTNNPADCAACHPKMRSS
jgi:hypothetical protein